VRACVQFHFDGLGNNAITSTTGAVQCELV